MSISSALQRPACSRQAKKSKRRLKWFLRGSLVFAAVFALPISAFCDFVPDDFVYIQGGTFLMGAEDGDRDESPAHRVTVRDFHMAKYMVTFDQYDAYCNDAGIPRPYDTSWGRGNLPVINVNWFDAVRYCNWLSRKEGLTQPYTIRGKSVKWNREADGYRLPTEAEWEFAARGGNLTLETLFPGSNNPKEVAWYGRNSGGITHPVGTKQPNELGLYDMSGNLWEWCWDWHGRYSAVDQSDPIGPKSGRYRVLRGGSWCNNNVMVLRITNRSWDKPVDLGNYIGFRLALPVTE